MKSTDAVFAEKIAEICARAKVNLSTFYLHYETIGDLLMETMSLISNRD